MAWASASPVSPLSWGYVAWASSSLLSRGLHVEGACGGCMAWVSSMSPMSMGCVWRVCVEGAWPGQAPHPIRGLRVGCLWRVHGLGRTLCHPVHGLRVEGACGRGCVWRVCRRCLAWASPRQPLAVGCMWRAACGGAWPGQAPPPLSMGCVWRVRVEGAWPGRAPCAPVHSVGWTPSHTTPDQGGGGGDRRVLTSQHGLGTASSGNASHPA